MAAEFQIQGIDHIQLAMPPGQEDAARRFYGEILGLEEVVKPAELAKRGGVWFRGGALNLHLGVESDFRPARKAHPALLVRNLAALQQRIESAGIAVQRDGLLPGYERVFVEDCFGNRVELLEPLR